MAPQRIWTKTDLNGVLGKKYQCALMYGTPYRRSPEKLCNAISLAW
ncbi:rCG48954 [Rattus norvegicus]|uniref:RCG48954 n=1 Tax=Rattus norvegicus TaxID=10116 RepID=A6IGR0_RAT|nr:rCG48954 [Rattus norvegicus]